MSLLTRLLSKTGTTAVQPYPLYTWGDNSVGQLGQSSIVLRSSPSQVGSSNWSSVSSGNSFTVAIKTDGSLWAWGVNNVGQLGVGDVVYRSSPTQIGSATNWSRVTAGNSHAAAITSTGILYAWGDNTYGQLGDLTVVGKSNPVQVGSSSWTLVSAGGFHTLATNSFNKLFGWGRGDNYFQHGLGDGYSRSSPVQVSTLSSVSIVQISAGEYHNHAISNTGEAYGWGNNYNGEIGYVPRSFVSISQYAPNGFTGLDSLGTLWSWGQANYTGLGDTIARSSPTQVPAPVRFTYLYANVSVSAALDTNQKLWMWGDNNYGTIPGYGTPVLSPVQVITDKSWTQVQIGYVSVMGLDNSNNLWFWGANYSGICGLGSTYANSAIISSPVLVAAGISKFSLGYAHAFSIKTNGTLWAWGTNSGTSWAGALGINTTTNRSSPVQVGSATNWTGVLAGLGTSYGFQNDGSVWAWGFGTSGQLGIQLSTSRSNPVQVLWDGATGFSSIATYTAKYGVASPTFVIGPGTASYPHISTTADGGPIYFLDTNKHIWYLGKNNNTVTGSYGTMPYSYNPGTLTLLHSLLVGYGPATRYNAVLSSSYYSTPTNTAFVVEDGSVNVHGVNAAGVCGVPEMTVGTTTPARSSPVQMGSGSNPFIPIPTKLDQYVMPASFTQISASRSSTVSLGTDGKIYTWGTNTSGKLGQHFKVEYVTGSTSSQYAFLAITSNNVIYAWGSGVSSWPGGGASAPAARSSPYQITAAQPGISTATYAMWGNSAFLTLPKVIPNKPINDIFLSNSGGAYLDYKNRVWVWGSNPIYSGLQGAGTVARYAPTRANLDDVTKMSLKTDTMFYLRSSSPNVLFGCGYSSFGELNQYLSSPTYSPVVVSSDCKDFWQFPYTIIWRASDNSIWGAGRQNGWMTFNAANNSTGGLSTAVQIFNGTEGVSYTSFAVENAVSNVVAGLKTNGSVWTWGYNAVGSLIGVSPAVTNTNSPVQVFSSGVMAVYAGANSFIAHKTDYSVWFWGGNGNGMAGNIGAKSTPVQLTWNGITSWKQVVFDRGGSLMLLAFDGSLYAAGFNGNGQLGDSSTLNRSSPIQVPLSPAMFNTVSPYTSVLMNISTSSFTQVSAKGDSSYAIRSDNTIWSWGDNTTGQLGLGDNVNRSSPVQISTISNTTGSFTQIVAGNNHASMIFKPNL